MESRPGTSSTSTDVAMERIHPDLQFKDLSRETDVKFFTGFESREILKMVFEDSKQTAASMTYWRGDRITKPQGELPELESTAFELAKA